MRSVSKDIHLKLFISSFDVKMISLDTIRHLNISFGISSESEVSVMSVAGSNRLSYQRSPSQTSLAHSNQPISTQVFLWWHLACSLIG